MRGGLLLITGLLLAGCEAQSAAPVRAPAPAPRLAAPWDGGPLRVGERGVGPIDAATPFSADALAALFPGQEVEARSLADGSPVVLVLEPALVARIDGSRERGTLSAVHVTAKAAVGPNGERINDPFARARFDAGQCAMDPPVLRCRRTADSHVAFVYAAPGPRGEAPPSAEVVMRDGFLATMIWTPGPG